MAHAKPDDLKDLSFLLADIRELQGLKEKSLGCFYFKSKGVLHFHVQQGRRFAHVFDGTKWQEIDLPEDLSAAKQRSQFKAIAKILPISNTKVGLK